MKQSEYSILSNECIANKVYRMRLSGVTDGIRAGQFVEIALANRFLRRPISVCDVEDGVLTLIYKVVGDGTADMSSMCAGEVLNLLVNLGNGYDLGKAGEKPLLVGGGVGVPPLYMAAKMLRQAGKDVQVVLGFNTANEVFYEQEFRALGCDVRVFTMDGSHGQKGVVTDGMDGLQTYYYACGPMPMLRALVAKVGTQGEVSMEERMGCGFGICVGCTIETANGPKRVCKEGPVFAAAEIKW